MSIKKNKLGDEFYILINYLKYKIKNIYKKQKVAPIGTQSTKYNINDISNILKKYSNENEIFIHCGLKKITENIECENAYEYLIKSLSNNFESIIVPAYTPQYRELKNYDILKSKPVYGAFSKLFKKDMDYRTDDAIHSLFVKGKKRFYNENHRDSFGKNSCFERLDKENILYCNIGTNELISTQLHYIEKINKVPYILDDEIPGTFVDIKGYKHKIIQKNYKKNRKLYTWNRKKIEKLLEKNNLIDVYYIGTLKISFFRAQELRKVLEKKLNKDIYYLIK